MMKILKIIGLGLFCFLVFVLMTFPYSRIAPKIRTGIESGIRTALGESVSCSFDGFDITYTLSIRWSHLSCQDSWDQALLELNDADLSILPGRQRLTGKMGAGKISLKANAGIASAPSRISAEFDKVALAQLAPLLLSFANRANPNIPKELKLEGLVSGKFDFPLKNMAKENGNVDLQIASMKVPAQSLLERFGFAEIVMTKSSVKADLKAGKLVLSDVAFLSDQLSGKAEGSVELQPELAKSTAALALKWKIVKSDALMSSPLGMMLASAPCPSPDSDGFCSRRITRLSDLMF